MNYFRLIVSLIIPQVAGIIGSFFTVQGIKGWYAGLIKPSFNPPGWIFSPVWITLYVLMGISIYLIWSAYDKASAGQRKKLKITFWLFWAHLFFNATWSIMFFGLKSAALGLINIAIIWVFILVLMIRFWKIKKLASYLLIPYFLWVSFASVLNFFLWYLN